MKNLINILGIITKPDSSELSDEEYSKFIDAFNTFVEDKDYMFNGGFEHLTTEEFLNK